MQGTLNEFRLAEILQLVAVQQKTGLLRVARGEEILTLYFERGEMIACRDRRHPSQDPLLEYLQRYGFLDAEAGEALRTKSAVERLDLADLLIAEQFLTEEEMLAVLEDLAQDLVYRTFSWREGTYRFVSGDQALEGLRHTLRLKMEGLLMEAARRADEWPRLLEKLPGPDVLLGAVDRPPTSLGPRVHQVLSRLTESMRLGELVRRARLPEFEVYETLVLALEAQAVRILEIPVVPPARAEALAQMEAAPRPGIAGRRQEKTGEDTGTRRQRRSAPEVAGGGRTLARPVAWVLAAVASVACVLGALVLGPQLATSAAHESAEALASEQAREELRQAVEVYIALHGRCPESLADLAADDLASPELLQRAWPVRYTPEPDGRSFRFLAPPAAPEH